MICMVSTKQFTSNKFSSLFCCLCCAGNRQAEVDLYIKCARCGFRVLKASTSGINYDERYFNSNADFLGRELSLLSKFLDCYTSTLDTILDWGCGNGLLSLKIKSRQRAYIGIDSSPYILASSNEIINPANAMSILESIAVGQRFHLIFQDSLANLDLECKFLNTALRRAVLTSSALVSTPLDGSPSINNSIVSFASRLKKLLHLPRNNGGRPNLFSDRAITSYFEGHGYVCVHRVISEEFSFATLRYIGRPVGKIISSICRYFRLTSFGIGNRGEYIFVKIR
jgi:SAM-dependent methyltransferase